jgi:7-cyano-7-deazaguanine synthase
MSGGLDSAVLAASEAQTREVQPIYVSCGFPWEAAERALLQRFLTTHRPPCAYRPLAALSLPMNDVYPASHWAMRGVPPGYDTADEDVYLVGRNVTLLAKAGVYCALTRIGRIAMGQLRGNPFPDATPEFFATMARALSLGLDHRLEIVFPFLSKTKADVIRLGASLGVPFELTVSCLHPQGAGHCGACSKCRERREAFTGAGVEDSAAYARA